MVLLHLTRVDMHHTCSSPETISSTSIERMVYDDDYRCTDIYLTSGKTLSVLQPPTMIEDMIRAADRLRPENYDEIEACIALVWGPEGDHLKTKGELRAACEAKIKEMRDECSDCGRLKH